MSEEAEPGAEEILPGSLHIPAAEYEPVCCRFCHAEFVNLDFIAGHFVRCPVRLPGRLAEYLRN
jgi:hypothetical protein